jgi:hypothetical protein
MPTSPTQPILDHIIAAVIRPADLHLPTDVARASAGHLSPHIPDGGEHGYGDEEKDREDDHHMVGHAPES